VAVSSAATSLTTYPDYASSPFLLVIDDYLQMTTLLGVTLKER
jgi:hypothetical protein